MPVLLDADLVLGNAQCSKLRQFAEAAFQLAESRESSQTDDVFPQLERLLRGSGDG